jgi:hypothetical protein
MFPKVGKHKETNVSATNIALGKHEMFLNLIGNISASREANCVSEKMFPGVQGRIQDFSYVSQSFRMYNLVLRAANTRGT